ALPRRRPPERRGAPGRRERAAVPVRHHRGGGVVSAAHPTDADRPTPRFGTRSSGVAAYLGMAVSELSDGTEPLALLRGPFLAPGHIADDDGRTPTGVLAALVGSIGGLASGIACVPDWIVTTNLT